MRKILIAAAAVGVLAAIPTTASADPGNGNAYGSCFGQARADYAQNGAFSVGYWASQRKGDNSTLNAAFREACSA